MKTYEVYLPTFKVAIFDQIRVYNYIPVIYPSGEDFITPRGIEIDQREVYLSSVKMVIFDHIRVECYTLKSIKA